MNHKAMAVGLFCLFGVGAAGAADTAKSVMDCMRANAPESVRIQDFELSVTEPDGETRTLAGRVYAQRETKGKDAGLMRAMMRVEQPDNLKGAAYLVRETDDYLRDGMYVYLPSVRRVRRVSGTFADGSLLGTTFSYYDFKQISSAFGDLSAELLPSEKLGERPMHVLAFKPLEGAETQYSSVRAWVDRETCLPMRADFSIGEQVRKRLSAAHAALRTADGYRYLAEVEMLDLQSKVRSTLKINKVSLDKGLSRRYFDPNAFHFGH